MGFINFMVGFAWEIILIFVAFALFGCLTKNGFGVIKEILNTIVSMMRALGKWVREKCQDYLDNKELAKQLDKETAATAYNEYLKSCRAKCMTFEEFAEKMRKGDRFTID
jgi:hypothetical protein